MTSGYSEIYSRFYLKVEDYKISGLEEDTAFQVMNGWIKTVLSKPYIRRLFGTVMMDDYLNEISYTLKHPVEDEEDKDFIEEVIALGMVVEWLSPKYHSSLNTDQFFSNSEQKWYSQAAHMSEIREMYHSAKNDLRKIIRDKGYIANSYLGNA